MGLCHMFYLLQCYSSVVRPLQRNTESGSPPPALFVTRATPSSPRVPVFVGPLTNAATLKKSAFSPLSSSPPRNGVLKSLSNVRRTPQPRHHLHSNHDRIQLQNQGQRNPTESEVFVWPRYDKPRHLCIPGLHGSGSSGDMGHISDSEFYPRVSQAPSWGRKEEEEKWDEEVDGSEGDEGEHGRWEEGEGEARFSRIVTSLPISGITPRSSFCDRNIRDINILKRLAVPFSYEEVAYSSNERFREIKSKPGLTLDQVN